jgi:molybdopterin/thiamine biosynthesis adenylyltransferase
MDYSHHSTVVQPADFTDPIHIIGVGATGSWVALLLAKLGLAKNIKAYDFDVVEEHNIANQAYVRADIGVEKAAALRIMIATHVGEEISIFTEKIDELYGYQGYIFNLVDTMASRKTLFDTCMSPNVKAYIETRLSVEGGRIYVINPLNANHRDRYKKTLYDDGEAEVSACGTSQTVVATAMMLASKAVWEMLKHHEKNEYEPFFGEILFDIFGNEIRTEWGQ